eukprot:14711650-Ditylum_brightwellii.AAC.1
MDDLVGDRRTAYVTYVPSAINDANKCKEDLEVQNMEPSGHRKRSFEALVNFLVDGMNKGDYDIQGPVLKPLQSLFNKMFIRRGQTSVSIVGDMTRATLLIKDEENLRGVVSRIEELFPQIYGEQFDGPDKIGVDMFLHQVFKMKKIPGSDIIPYRFKPNSSQKERMGKGEASLYYNFNFFDGIPEYHQVGSTEMFVAFELQIGLEDEVSGLREDHVSYEERRVLDAQPLLKAYKEAYENVNAVGMSKAPAPSSLAEMSEDNDDFELISSVLGGNFVNCKYREFGKKQIDGEEMAP